MAHRCNLKRLRLLRPDWTIKWKPLSKQPNRAYQKGVPSKSTTVNFPWMLTMCKTVWSTKCREIIQPSHQPFEKLLLLFCFLIYRNRQRSKKTTLIEVSWLRDCSILSPYFLGKWQSLPLWYLPKRKKWTKSQKIRKLKLIRGHKQNERLKNNDWHPLCYCKVG